MSDSVILKKEGAIGWIAMNREKTLNSINSELCDALCEAMADCENDPEVRVVVLYGNGRAFCAGGDLKTLLSLTDFEIAKEYIGAAGKVTLAIMGSKKPYVAMVHGAAAGAGFNLSLACDFVCAAKGTKFTQAFSSIGLIPDCGGLLLLPQLVGPRTARKLMMLPETITAEQAQALDIVTELAEPEELRDKTEAFAKRLAKQPPLSLANIKKMLNDCDAMAKILEEETVIQSTLVIGEDCKEGINAFFEKRKAVFKGRS